MRLSKKIYNTIRRPTQMYWGMIFRCVYENTDV